MTKNFGQANITTKPTDLQLDIFSHFKIYKEWFYCFLDDDTVVYRFENDWIRIGEKELFIKQNAEHQL